MVALLEHCRIAPPPNATAKTSLPLTYFDLFLFNFPPVQHLFFFDSPLSKSHFLEYVIPNLKDSLSLALHHFFPLAGNLIVPIDKSTKPDILYEEGDSVSLTIAESDKDLNHLAGNHPRNAIEFYDLLPEMPKFTKVFDQDQSHVANKVPLMAIQVTLFPGAGVCIGLTYQHMTTDGRTFFNFLQTWASISKLGTDTKLSLPSFDRSPIINNPDGVNQKMDGLYEQCEINEQVLINRVRSTFVLTGSDIDRLKKLVLNRRPNLTHLSTFTVACAYSWVCKLKSGSMEDELVDEMEYFGVAVDCRGRTEPPIPANYFGNCLSFVFTEAKRSVLVGEGGFEVAAELIGEAIGKMISKPISQERLFEDTKALLAYLQGVNMDRIYSVAGSPKMAVYDLDFGFGKPNKRDIVSIDGTGAISMTKGRNGDLEIGLSLAIDAMDSFSALFISP